MNSEDQELQKYMIDQGLIDAPQVIREQVAVEVGESGEGDGEYLSEPVVGGDDTIAASNFDIALKTTEPDWYIEPDYMEYFYKIWPSLPDQPIVKLSGPPGTGKTLAAEVLAARLKRPLLKMECEPDMTAQELLGISRIRGGTDYWQPGIFQIAAEMAAAGRNPICFLDEFSVLSPATQYKLAPFVREVTSFTVCAIGRRFDWKHPKLILGYNEDQAGNREITGPIRDRGRTIECDYLPEDEEAAMLIQRKNIDGDLARKAVRAANSLRAAAKGVNGTVPLDFHCTWRALEDFADGVNYGQPIERAWREAILGRVGNGARMKPTRDTVTQISITSGMMA